MSSLFLVVPNIPTPNHSFQICSRIQGTTALTIGTPSRPTCPIKGRLRFISVQRRYSGSNPQTDEEEEDDDPETQVQELRVPDTWLDPSNALQESEWLRGTLHKWLDDEYCPEPTNLEISKIAARSYYKSLVDKQTDLGEILLKMAIELESISYQESFHGAFSSANAAISLILQRIEQD